MELIEWYPFSRQGSTITHVFSQTGLTEQNHNIYLDAHQDSIKLEQIKHQLSAEVKGFPTMDKLSDLWALSNVNISKNIIISL